jgi:D-mannonate dehydratase
MEYNLLENKIESIPTCAFNNLKRVHFVNLRNNSINHISSRAFEMIHEEGETGSYSAIKLNHNKLTSNSFELGAFDELDQTINNKAKPICWSIEFCFNEIT